MDHGGIRGLIQGYSVGNLTSRWCRFRHMCDIFSISKSDKSISFSYIDTFQVNTVTKKECRILEHCQYYKNQQLDSMNENQTSFVFEFSFLRREAPENKQGEGGWEHSRENIQNMTSTRRKLRHVWNIFSVFSSSQIDTFQLKSSQKLFLFESANNNLISTNLLFLTNTDFGPTIKHIPLYLLCD